MSPSCSILTIRFPTQLFGVLGSSSSLVVLNPDMRFSAVSIVKEGTTASCALGRGFMFAAVTAVFGPVSSCTSCALSSLR
jgi:hypothetical protein